MSAGQGSGLGWVKMLTSSTTTAGQVVSTFTVPVAAILPGGSATCILHYMDVGVTGYYKIGAGAWTALPSLGAVVNSPDTYRIGNVSLGTQASGTTIAVGNQSAIATIGSSGVGTVVAGMSCIVQATGLGVAQVTCPGQSLSELTPVGSTLNTPSFSAALAGGGSYHGTGLQGPLPTVYTPGTLGYANNVPPTLTYTTGGALSSTTAYWWGLSYLGVGGESAIFPIGGTSSLGAPTAGMGGSFTACQIAGIMNDKGQGPPAWSQYPVENRIIYRCINPTLNATTGLPVAGTVWYECGGAGTTKITQPSSASSQGWWTTTGASGQKNTNPNLGYVGATTFVDTWADATITGNPTSTNQASPSLDRGGYGFPLGGGLNGEADVFILSMGGNDCNFDTTDLAGGNTSTGWGGTWTVKLDRAYLAMNEILSAVKAANPAVAIVILGNATPSLSADSGPFYATNSVQRYAQYAQMMKWFAEHYSGCFIDMAQTWGQNIAQYIDPATRHPNAAGHQSIANQIVLALSY